MCLSGGFLLDICLEILSKIMKDLDRYNWSLVKPLRTPHQMNRISKGILWKFSFYQLNKN
jgi:hypothetical protein